MTDFNTKTAICFLISSMLGSGINFMPAAFNNSGYLFAFGFLIIVACITGFTSYNLLRCCNKNSSTSIISYSSITNNKNKILNLILIGSMVSAEFLSIVAFQSYLRDLFYVQASTYFPEEHSIYSTTKLAILAIIAALFSALAWKKEAGYLKYVSIVGLSCVFSLITVLITLNASLKDFINTIQTPLEQERNYTFSFSLFVMSMFVQAVIPNLYNSLKDQSKKNLIILSSAGALSGFLIYGSVGFLGYRLMGSCIGTKDLMRIFLDNNSPLNQYLNNNNDIGSVHSSILKWMVKIQGFFGMGIVLVSLPFAFIPTLDFLKALSPVQYRDSELFHRFLVLLLTLISTSINLIPNISLNFIFEMLGPTAVNYIAFFLPSVLYYLYSENKTPVKKVLALLIMVLSSGYMIYGSYNGIKGLFVPFTDQDNVCFNNITNKLQIKEIN